MLKTQMFRPTIKCTRQTKWSSVS